jgi:hypothetical protein
MKNKKLQLSELQVTSFITKLEASDKIKGGAESIVCLTGMYPTLPIQNCTTNCFTNTSTDTLTN